MRTLYIDCGSGMSGDMMLGAFIGLGVSLEFIKKELATLGIDEFDLRQNEVKKGDVTAHDVEVVIKDRGNADIHPYSDRFRNYGDIKAIIDRSNITSTAKDLSRKIFDIKAGAEARVHGILSDQVQFHEAGAVDSIVDIVGTAIAYDHLDIDRVVSTHVPTGFGTVMCACGELPVPAPAVVAIIEEHDIPNYRSHIKQELLTPTGASFLAALVDEFREDSVIPEGAAFGYGTGKRDTGLKPLKLAVYDG